MTRILQKSRFRRLLPVLFTAALVCTAVLPPAAAQESISPGEQAGIQNDISRHFGTTPLHPGSRAANLSGSLRPKAVRRAMRKVGDWELKQAQPYFGRNWTWAVS